METSQEWIESDGTYRLGAATGQRQAEAFVIMSFGANPDTDQAFRCIVAAMRFGKIAVRSDDGNRQVARELAQAGLVRFSPFVGLPFDALGVVGVKTSAGERR